MSRPGEQLIGEALEAWRPPRRLNLSQWADEHAYLSAESAAEPGKWRTVPYQRGIMDALTDTTIERVIVMKSARVGYTKIINNLVGFHMHQDPCPIMVVQPTVEDAEGYSKEEIAPMLRDTPVLRGLVTDKAKKPSATILNKAFPGGSLSMVGANSPRGFRRVSRRVVVFDEISGYPASAGKEGDPFSLGVQRSSYYWNRKIVAGSTPTTKDDKIEELFKDGDQRRYFVPCPHCGEMQYLKWGGPDKPYGFKWEAGKPETVYYLCEKKGCAIDHSSKRWMVERGEWIATAEGKKRWASFHIWAAYSYSPNAEWAMLVEEFLSVKDDPLKLQTFINTVLGETWEERGEKVDAHLLANRLEDYGAEVPNGVGILTAFVDVQTAGTGRLELSIFGFGRGEEAWLILHDTIPGDPTQNDVWLEADKLLTQQYEHASGRKMIIKSVLVDSGDGNTSDHVYRFTKAREARRVHGEAQYVASSKGDHGFDKDIAGRPRLNNRYRAKFYMLGVDAAKRLFMRRLQIALPPNASSAPGFVHLPDFVDAEYLEQLTSEKMIVSYRKGQTAIRKWVKQRERNEALDCAVGCIAALYVLGRKTILQLGALADQMMLPPNAQPQGAPEPTGLEAIENTKPKQRGWNMDGFGGGGGGWTNGWK